MGLNTAEIGDKTYMGLLKSNEVESGHRSSKNHDEAQVTVY